VRLGHGDALLAARVSTEPAHGASHQDGMHSPQIVTEPANAMLSIVIRFAPVPVRILPRLSMTAGRMKPY
jgi:hypothetical protein